MTLLRYCACTDSNALICDGNLQYKQVQHQIHNKSTQINEGAHQIDFLPVRHACPAGYLFCLRVYFFFLNKPLSKRISGSTGTIFTKFSPYGI